jgi:hypothetical protein
MARAFECDFGYQRAAISDQLLAIGYQHLIADG